MAIHHTLSRIFDWFYIKPLRKIMPIQVFRYLMCGLVNFVVTIACYAVAYNFIFAKQDLDLGFVTISPHIAALGISLPVNFLLGFWLQRNISFKKSPLKGRVQFVRHISVAMVALVLTYLLTKLFVDVCHIYPTAAQIIIYLITAVVSYTGQKYFTFRGAQKE